MRLAELKNHPRAIAITVLALFFVGLLVYVALHPYQPSLTADVVHLTPADSTVIGHAVGKEMQPPLDGQAKQINALTGAVKKNKKGIADANKRIGEVDKKADDANKKIDGVDARVQGLEKSHLNEEDIRKAIHEELQKLPELVPLSRLEMLEKEVAQANQNFRRRSTS